LLSFLKSRFDKDFHQKKERMLNRELIQEHRYILAQLVLENLGDSSIRVSKYRNTKILVQYKFRLNPFHFHCFSRKALGQFRHNNN